jgi:hypothetical protein
VLAIDDHPSHDGAYETEDADARLKASCGGFRVFAIEEARGFLVQIEGLIEASELLQARGRAQGVAAHGEGFPGRKEQRQSLLDVSGSLFCEPLPEQDHRALLSRRGFASGR